MLKFISSIHVFWKIFLLCSLCSAKSGSQLLHNSSASELDVAEDLKRKLCQAKEEKVDIIIKHNQEVSFFLFSFILLL